MKCGKEKEKLSSVTEDWKNNFQRILLSEKDHESLLGISVIMRGPGSDLPIPHQPCLSQGYMCRLSFISPEREDQ